MAPNFHTAYEDGLTPFTAAPMGAPLLALDTAIGYRHNLLAHCDGAVAFDPSSGALSWAAPLRLAFLGSDGQAYANQVTAGSITLASGEFAYVDLAETEGQVLIVAKAALTTGAAANFAGVARVLLGVRNAAGGAFYPVLAGLVVQGSAAAPGLVIGSEAAAATVTFDLAAYDVADLTLVQATTINLTGGSDGKPIVLRLRQDATGGRVVAWGAMCRGSVAVPLPVLSATAATLDYVAFRYNSADGVYDCQAHNMGF